MVRLHISPLDVDDAAAVQDVIDVMAAADVVDRPWHPGSRPVLIRALATHGWDDVPERFFLGRDDTGQAVATGSVTLPMRDNRHAALVSVRVVPDRRGQHRGSALYDHLEGVATDHGRTRLFTGGPESDAGRRFAERRGYAMASVGMLRRVDLGEVSADDVQAAYDEAAARAQGYELVRLVGPMPDDLLDAYVTAVSAINDAPLDDLEIDDEVYDADRVRYYEQGQLLGGHRLYRVLALDRATGEIAGHTVVAVEAERPHLGEQHDTTVVGGHRGHRLGLLLKADMMRWLREVEPELRSVVTHNAASNDHMIAVNERLGYRVVGRSNEFQREMTDASSPRTGSGTGTA